MSNNEATNKSPARGTKLMCKDNPEWGTWHVTRNDHSSLEIRSQDARRERVLDWDGEGHFWKIVK